MTIEFTPIGYVTEVLSHDAESKHTVNMRERIQILPEYREGLNGLECGNKIQLIFHFHLSKGYSLAVFAKGGTMRQASSTHAVRTGLTGSESLR